METVAISSSLKVSLNRSVKALTQSEIDETPEWIKNLCTDWLQVISHFSKNGKAYKFYNEKISGLLEVIRPAYLIGVKNWLNSDSGVKNVNKQKILKSHLEGTLKLIKILSSSNNLVYLYAIKELESLLKQI
jgi:hypothetical protein